MKFRKVAPTAGALAIAAALSACVGSGDLGRDAFVGDWTCGGETVALTSRTIKSDDGTENIAWIESGKNADFDLFTTRGARYSVFDQKKNSLTLFSHKTEKTRSCTRVG